MEDSIIVVVVIAVVAFRMAYINVAEWSPDQVTDWLKGMTNFGDFSAFLISLPSILN